MSKKKKKIYCTYVRAPEHVMTGHPESPQRISAIQEWLADPPYPEMCWLESEPAEETAVLRVHRAALLSALQRECRIGVHEFEPAPSYVTHSSYEAALLAAGATLAVSRKIISKGFGRGFAIVRPPGHHAESEVSMGFCLLNNVAIAAADALDLGLARVAIVDFDAHHGNGTEEIFRDVSEVGYLSSHEGGMYPGTGRLHDAAHARGRIINVPLQHQAGGKSLKKVINSIVKPWLRMFRPQMLFVSAGYDAHFSDGLTSLNVDTRSFYHISRKLVELAEDYCEGRILFVLEGGYDPIALQDNIQATLAAMCDRQSFPDRHGKGPRDPVDSSSLVESVIRLHRLPLKEK